MWRRIASVVEVVRSVSISDEPIFTLTVMLKYHIGRFLGQVFQLILLLLKTLNFHIKADKLFCELNPWWQNAL